MLLSQLANGTIYPARFVTPDSAVDRAVIQATAGAPILGISWSGQYPTNTPLVAAGSYVTVFVPSGIAPLKLGATVARGAFLMADANGQGITCTTGNYFGAIAQQAGNAGDFIDVEVVLGILGGGGGSGVTTFNTRTGAVTLTSGDVTIALGDANLVYTDVINTFSVGPQAFTAGITSTRGTASLHNEAFGALAMTNATPSGSSNTAVGGGAHNRLTTGSQNTSLGYFAGYFVTTGHDNVYIGNGTTAAAAVINNVVIGSNAGGGTAGQNVVIGVGNGTGITSGTNNIFLGYRSNAAVLTTGGGCVCIGADADTAASDTAYGVSLGFGAMAANNQFAVGPFEDSQVFQVRSTTLAVRSRADFTISNIDNTDATRKYRIVHNVWDTAARECIRFDTDGSGANASLFGAGSYGSGRNVVSIANAAVNPSANPTGGGILYSNAGAGTWRGSSGTVTAFGPAGPHCGQCGYDHWRAAYRNDDWGSYLYECGMCGKTYKKGPQSVLDRLTSAQRAEVLND